MSINEQVEEYAKKFKEFDDSIIDGVSVCYKHSPLYREHIQSPHFGEVKGWRITWMWTEKVKRYPSLKLVGPLDLGLYSVRIDSVLGNSDIDAFLDDAEGLPIFQQYITATAEFIKNLIRDGETRWANSRSSNVDVKNAIDLCAEYSPTFKKVLQNLKNDHSWDVVNLWVDDPYDIRALRRISPLDLGIYCVRIDSINKNIDLTEFKEKADMNLAFDRFPQEITQFIFEVLRRRYNIE